MQEHGTREKKNVDDSFPKPWMTSSNVLFLPQPRGIPFTVIGESRNKKIFTLKKLESEK